MANRNTLCVENLNDFKEWLISDGWEIQQLKGYYEVLRATKQIKKYPLIVYKRLDTNNGKNLVHYTIQDRHVGVLRAYLKARKQNG